MNEKINRIDAVHSLGFHNFHGPESGDFVFPDGETPPTEEAIQAEIIKLQAEYDAQEYARNRKAEYPDWGSQLNKIYDDGLDKWKSEMVDPIKAKYPKPE
tara:strand:- start:39 stop:338 length:300 start_codon:yes stop_codon:yes gene_type:complete